MQQLEDAACNDAKIRDPEAGLMKIYEGVGLKVGANFLDLEWAAIEVWGRLSKWFYLFLGATKEGVRRQDGVWSQGGPYGVRLVSRKVLSFATCRSAKHVPVSTDSILLPRDQRSARDIEDYRFRRSAVTHDKRSLRAERVVRFQIKNRTHTEVGDLFVQRRVYVWEQVNVWG